MRKILRSPLALKDAQKIWLHSYETWGETQANHYLIGLDATIKKLAESPEYGLNIHQLRPGYYRYKYESHLIIYRYTQTQLEVVRILHKRMDIIRHKIR